MYPRDYEEFLERIDCSDTLHSVCIYNEFGEIFEVDVYINPNGEIYKTIDTESGEVLHGMEDYMQQIRDALGMPSYE